MKMGKVVLVGAGPGDGRLITEKGNACIKEADVIVYDALACPSVLNMARSDCQLIYVGKQAGCHFMEQEEINLLLVEFAKKGKNVVRLKGGDPFIFGRGGEEALVLRKYQIPFEVVPGVSSCYAAPAYAGIPVTHRSCTSAFHVFTGHKQLNNQLDMDYESIARLDGTLVFLMSLMNLPYITEELIANGKSPNLPAAVIQQGTMSKQKTVVATLGTIAEEVRKQQVNTPAMTIIGDVVMLREKIQWFENGKLFGKKIVATGTPLHAKKLADELNKYGADTVELSLIKTTCIHLDCLKKIQWSAYTWVVLTSVNGVQFFFDALTSCGIDLRKILHLKFAAIGSGTAESLAEKGIFVDCVPERFESKYLADALIPQLSTVDKLLLIRAENGTTVLQKMLKKAGIDFDTVMLYRTETDYRKKELLKLVLKDTDYVIFSSASAVKAFEELHGMEKGSHVKMISIGAVTTRAAEEIGIPIYRTACQADIAGIARCILNDN